MKNFKLNLNLVFGNEDLPAGKNFNDEFNMLKDSIFVHLDKIVDLQTSVKNAVDTSVSFANFTTSNKCKQSFPIILEITEHTFFSIRINGVIKDSKGVAHSFTKNEKLSCTTPAWFGGFDTGSEESVTKPQTIPKPKQAKVIKPATKPDITTVTFAKPIEEPASLSTLKGLVKKAAHSSGVHIPKFSKELYQQADTELHACYGHNPHLINITTAYKHLNENRKRLLIISKNNVEIANITGIDSTIVNLSMKHAPMIPGRDVYAVHLYLTSIAKELEEIQEVTA